MWQVRQANPNVSFSANPTDDDLRPFGYANVNPVPQPEVDWRIQRVEETLPEESGGVYYQQWSIRNATEQEIYEYDNAHLPAADWKGFATEVMVNTEVNSLLSTVLSQLPGIYGGLTVGLSQAGQGDPSMFMTSWDYLVNMEMVDQETISLLQSLANKYNLPVNFYGV